MRRREFLGALGGTALAQSFASTAGASTTRRRAGGSAPAQSGTVPALAFDSTASLLAFDYTPLTDSSLVPVWAEGTAFNHDEDGDADATVYGESQSIPLVATDWNVVGFGAMLLTNGTNFQYGNEEFVLNVWDDALGGSGTVLWDEGHGQYYTLSMFSEFETYAENAGYTVTATTSLGNDLSGADAAVITSPASAFTGADLTAIGNFVSNGGWLFLHDQSDYSNFDGTSYLNDVAGYLELGFRFNDDEVLDAIQNAGSDYQPTTDEFNTSFSYFSDRAGLGLDPTQTYSVSVTSVTDGDTVDVQFADGSTESIRVLGIDTPETSANSQFERIQEWEGIESSTHLETWASNASTFAQNEIGGSTVDLHFDSEEPVRDAFGRVLGYLTYDATGDGSRNTLYNRELAAQGYARVYDSGYTQHESVWDAEGSARSAGTGVWGQSDPDNSSEIRNRAVGDLFFPKAASVRTASGTIGSSRVPVTAESSATQDLDGGVSYSGSPPLVGLDESAGVAVVGGPIIDEAYESGEGFAVDTSSFENFVFATNLIDHLSSNTGDVLIDGGHGQFGASFGLSAEDAAYYMRYLEGQDIGFEGVNEITSANLSGARALIVTTPPQSFTSGEISAVNGLLSEGGAVVLVGSGLVSAGARSNLNALASGIGTDLRVNEDRVLDSTNNVNADSGIPTTTQFDQSFPLFDAYGSGGGGGGSADVVTTNVHADAAGSDSSNLNDEYIDVTNEGGTDADLTGYTVEDEVGKTYTFPSDFTLAADDTVRLHTGSGADTGTDLYWGRGSAVWNNGGDTVYIYDDSGSLVDQHSYGSSAGQPDVVTASVHADAAGNDTNNLNDEYVVIENQGTADADMTGWTVEDEVGKTYSFPNGFTLDEAESVTLHSGTGTDTGSDLYWGQTGSAVWNNGGDTVFIYDDSGTLVDEHGYGSSGGGSADVLTTSVHADAAGDDANNLNDEYVVISNQGGADADVTGWSVEDSVAKTYDFPNGFTLSAGSSVTLHSGTGTDTGTDLYWGRTGSAVWNNGGDTVYIYDDAGSLVDQHSY